MRYQIQVSSHPAAAQRIPTQDAIESWTTIFDGIIKSDAEARKRVEQLAKSYRNVRVFKSVNQPLGQFLYAVLQHVDPKWSEQLARLTASEYNEEQANQFYST